MGPLKTFLESVKNQGGGLNPEIRGQAEAAATGGARAAEKGRRWEKRRRTDET